MLDSDFASNGRRSTDFGRYISGESNSVPFCALSNGTYLFGGDIRNENYSKPSVYLYDDELFQNEYLSEDVFREPFANLYQSNINDIASQSDGKIVVTMTSQDSQSHRYIELYRFYSDKHYNELLLQFLTVRR